MGLSREEGERAVISVLLYDSSFLASGRILVGRLSLLEFTKASMAVRLGVLRLMWDLGPSR